MEISGHNIDFNEAQMDATPLLNSDNQWMRDRAKQALDMSNAILEHMSPPGALGLPPLLEERRLQYGIPDGAFRAQCAFERIYVWQLDDVQSETYFENGKIVRPDSVQQRDRRTCPRGIVVGAGLSALDVLYSHGMDLGHIVHFIRMAPFQRAIDTVLGHTLYVVVMNVGDITASEDTCREIREGEMRITRTETSKGTEHVFQRGGTQLERKDTQIREDL